MPKSAGVYVLPGGKTYSLATVARFLGWIKPSDQHATCSSSPAPALETLGHEFVNGLADHRRNRPALAGRELGELAALLGSNHNLHPDARARLRSRRPAAAA